MQILVSVNSHKEKKRFKDIIAIFRKSLVNLSQKQLLKATFFVKKHSDISVAEKITRRTDLIQHRINAGYSRQPSRRKTARNVLDYSRVFEEDVTEESRSKWLSPVEYVTSFHSNWYQLQETDDH